MSITWQEREEFPSWVSIVNHLVADHSQPDDAELNSLPWSSLIAIHRELGEGNDFHLHHEYRERHPLWCKCQRVCGGDQ